ncbi:MAG: hypothetical protein RL291_990 [Pseudomonadota bacterium]|jgi:hypothetical protein
MLRTLALAGAALTLTVSGLAAQSVPGDGQRRGEFRRDGERRGPPPVVVQQQRPVVVQQRPVIVQQRPVVVQQRPVIVQRSRPVIAYAPPPPPPVWSRSAYPYEQRFHSTCQQKAWRLRWYERRASADGVFTYREQAELRGLRRDLRVTCGGWRWRG